MKLQQKKLKKVFCYNRFYLIREFKLYTFYTIKEFINNIKVLKTINSLIFSDDSILKIEGRMIFGLIVKKL